MNPGSLFSLLSALTVRTRSIIFSGRNGTDTDPGHSHDSGQCPGHSHDSGQCPGHRHDSNQCPGHTHDFEHSHSRGNDFAPAPGKFAFTLWPILTALLIQVPVMAMQTEQEGVLLFRSGFEPESRIIHLGNPFTDSDKIAGRDLSVQPPNDWVEDIDNSDQLGFFSLQYQGADTTRRYARIIPEPGNPDNHVLLFRIHEPWVNQWGSHLARIQANIYDSWPNSRMEGIRELYQKVRLFMHEDMEVLKNYPHKIDWLTIFELWNNQTWDDAPYAFRITVGTGKPHPESRELYFMAEAEDYDTERGRMKIWDEMQTAIPVPIGQWMTLEFYIREGNDETGRFYMAMTPDGGEKKVIFDVQNYTHNTEDPEPTGIHLWNPMKLYTSTHLTNFVRDQGKSLQVYWDDLEIWKDRRPLDGAVAPYSDRVEGYDDEAAGQELADRLEQTDRQDDATTGQEHSDRQELSDRQGLPAGHYIQLLATRNKPVGLETRDQIAAMLQGISEVQNRKVLLTGRRNNTIVELKIGIFESYQDAASAMSALEGMIPDDAFIVSFPRKALPGKNPYEDIVILP